MIRRILRGEYSFFIQQPQNVRILLITNLIYALVLPVLELFVGAYILRQSSNSSFVVVYQLMVYTGIPVTFLLNGYLLRIIPITRLYSLGMLMSGFAMTVMMVLPELNIYGVGLVGFIMGSSYGFFWANRDFLSLSSTTDSNRNYYFSLETVFYTLTFILMPAAAGFFIGSGEKYGWYSAQSAYIFLTAVVFILTIIASIVVHIGSFSNPPKIRFIYLSFNKDWYWMLVMGACKGIAQAAIFFFPILLIMTFIGKEASLGGLVAASSMITAVFLYLIGRFSKPKHRTWIFGAGLLIFLIGGFINAFFFSAAGVIIYQLCNSLSRPLLDSAYFPIQLGLIDRISNIEKRNKFAYILNHEAGLFVGRIAGCLLFLATARYLSPEYALRYVLVIIALVQALSIPVAIYLHKKIQSDLTIPEKIASA